MWLQFFVFFHGFVFCHCIFRGSHLHSPPPAGRQNLPPLFWTQCIFLHSAITCVPPGVSETAITTPHRIIIFLYFAHFPLFLFQCFKNYHPGHFSCFLATKSHSFFQMPTHPLKWFFFIHPASEAPILASQRWKSWLSGWRRSPASASKNSLWSTSPRRWSRLGIFSYYKELESFPIISLISLGVWSPA